MCAYVYLYRIHAFMLFSVCEDYVVYLMYCCCVCVCVSVVSIYTDVPAKYNRFLLYVHCIYISEVRIDSDVGNIMWEDFDNISSVFK